MRVHWLLHELDVPYETFPIMPRSGETREKSYLALNPKGKIPLLVHGQFVLSESLAILRYLRNKIPVLPHDSYQLSDEGKARYDEWISFILMELDATSLYVIRRHKDLHEIYGEAPEAVNAALEYFELMLASIGDETGLNNYAWGYIFSEVDILLTVTLDWARFSGIELQDKFLRYLDRMHSREAYRAAYKKNYG